MKTNFKAGDQIKYYISNSILGRPQYGDVVRVNKKTITIKLVNGSVLRVNPRSLNFD